MVCLDLSGQAPYFSPVQLFNDYRLLIEQQDASCRVVSIGNFDGVHLGHLAVIEMARDIARRESLESAICTFEPHPFEIFMPGETRLRLVSPARKYRLLSGLGIDVVLAQHFDESFAALTAGDFASRILKDALRARIVVVGADFRFGKDRRGDVALLTDLGRTFGFAVTGAPLVERSGEPVSSSRIRRLLLDGNVGTAAELLGRLHEVEGRVVEGRQMGTALGYPTVNLHTCDVLLPGDGIYAAFCELPDNRRLPAAVYVGERPTLGHGRSLEAHLLDFRGDLYGAVVRVAFAERLRGDVKFETADALRAQIEQDVAAVRRTLEER